MAAEVYECVVNVSEGRDTGALAQLVAAAGETLLDLHRDPDHHRAVLTMAGPADAVALGARAVAGAVVDSLDLAEHAGVHPRLGVLDVVPFVPYEPGAATPFDLSGAVALRNAFAHWLGTELGVPAFLYGPLPGGATRPLPEVRRHAFGEARAGGLAPDYGPGRPDPRTGATAVGARRVLVAYNVWVSSVEVAREVAAAVRGPEVRALGLAVGGRAQVSCNLLAPDHYGPGALYDAVDALVDDAGGVVEGAELVGLIPERVLATVPRHRWAELGLSAEQTVERRLGAGATVVKGPGDVAGVNPVPGA